MLKQLSSYPKPLNIGRKELESFWDGNKVIVQEKIDGSQISFGMTEDGELLARSRKQPIIISSDTGGMFRQAVQTIMKIEKCLVPGWIYRGEYLQKPKHNLLQYSRVPENHIILFDIEYENGLYATPYTLRECADILDLETVPLIDIITDKPQSSKLDRYLNSVSILEGVQIEGLVFKNYNIRCRNGKIMMAKYVSPQFRERMHTKKPKVNNSDSDILGSLIKEFRTEARWRKAIQHLTEQGELTGKMEDMSALVREVIEDTREDFMAELNKQWPKFSKGLVKGLAAFYQKILTEENSEHD